MLKLMKIQVTGWKYLMISEHGIKCIILALKSSCLFPLYHSKSLWHNFLALLSRILFFNQSFSPEFCSHFVI